MRLLSISLCCVFAILAAMPVRGEAGQTKTCGPWAVLPGVTWGDVGHAGETGFVAVVHRDLPGQRLILRMPEYADLYHSLEPIPTRWTWIGSNELEMQWTADDVVKREHQVDRHAKFVFGADVIDVYATICNPSDRAWPAVRYDLYDVMCRESPAFIDTEGVRTYVYHDGGLKSIKDVWKEHLKPSGTGSMELTRADGSRTYLQMGDRIMAKVSTDGQWVLAIASDVGAGLSFNLDAGTSCIHQNPFWGALQAGEEKKIHCRVYLFRGTLDDLWRRYVQDFGATALHDENHAPVNPLAPSTLPGGP